jgi:hypothetical protein
VVDRGGERGSDGEEEARKGLESSSFIIII